MPARAVLVALVAASALLGGASGSSASAVTAHQALVRGNDGEWLSYGHDNRLDNSVISRSLSSATVGDLTTRWDVRLDGLVVASPLYAEPLIGGRRMGVIYAATEGGSVYALAGGDGRVLWQQSTAVFDFGDCGRYGISSTGAIDRSSNRFYVIGADGKLHAFDLVTGAEAAGYPLDLLPAPTTQYVWGGLRIVHGVLYVPVSSHCDELDDQGLFAEGGLVAIDLAHPDSRRFLDTVPGPTNGGGLWGYGGIAAEQDGSFLYTGVGNSHTYDATCACFRDDVGYGDRLIRFTPDLQIVDSDLPAEIDPVGDQDFGSAPVLFQPHGCPPLAAANNKNGVMYIWNRMKLEAGPIAVLAVGDSVSAFVGQPSWSARLQTLFDSEAVLRDGDVKLGYGIVAIKPTYNGCIFRDVWRTSIGAGNQAPPIAVGDVVFAGGGTGGIYALDGRTGTILWTAPTPGRPTFSPLIEARGVLVAPIGDGVTVFSLRDG